MDNTIINPTKQDYINDLLTDNKRSFGLIAHYRNVIKMITNDLLRRVTWALSEKDRVKCYEMLNKIMRYYDLIRSENIHVQENFRRIRDLKNGTIEEI